MADFFSNQKTEAPHLTPFWYVLLLIGLASVYYTSLRFYHSTPYRKLLKYLQILQIIGLYGWYLCTLTPSAESLPFYHCSLAALALLCLPDQSIYKSYFALLGIIGPICSTIYPIFDPFRLPHITFISYIIGHYALIGNSLIYLTLHKKPLSSKRIIYFTFQLNLIIVGINLLTDGNYGFLSQPPIIGNHGILFNYLFISCLLSAVLIFENKIYQKIKE